MVRTSFQAVADFAETTSDFCFSNQHTLLRIVRLLVQAVQTKDDDLFCSTLTFLGLRLCFVFCVRGDISIAGPTLQHDELRVLCGDCQIVYPIMVCTARMRCVVLFGMQSFLRGEWQPHRQTITITLEVRTVFCALCLTNFADYQQARGFREDATVVHQGQGIRPVAGLVFVD